MRILVTGASGFIGRAVCAEAVRRGHQVLALVRENSTGTVPAGTDIVNGTLDSPPWREIERFAPLCLLHLAWITQPGVYLHSPDNHLLLEQSQRLISRCLDMNVPHIAVAGTCLEYQAASAPLDELTSPVAPAFPYVQAKLDLWTWLQQQTAAKAATASWLRVFYPYGPGEHERRLPTLIMRQLAAGQQVLLRTPDSIKDYVFITDLAAAICEVVEQKISGPINLGSGSGVLIRDLATAIARQMNVSSDLVGEAPVPDKDPWPYHVANMQRLAAARWRPQVSLEQGLQLLMESLSPAAISS